MALEILVNSKARRPSVCNAAETLLVHADAAAAFVPAAVAALREAGVTVHADAAVLDLVGDVPGRGAGDRRGLRHRVPVAGHRAWPWSPTWTRRSSTSPRTAPGTPRRSSPSSLAAADEFAARVDAAAVMVNASTAFTDGGEFGFGAEIGISTQKLHARGPMGLAELTSTKYVVTGNGQIRASS